MKKQVLTISCVCLLLALLLFPETIFGSVTDADPYGQKAIADEAKKITDFAWKTLVPIMGGMSVITSLGLALASRSFAPVCFFFGLGILCLLLPKFVDGMFGSLGMMIP